MVAALEKFVQPSEGFSLFILSHVCPLGRIFDDLDRLVIRSPIYRVWDAVFASVGKAELCRVFP